MPQPMITDGDRAAHLHGILRNLETRLFETDVEQSARGAKDDDLRAGTEETFADVRKDLQAQIKRLRKDYADIISEVDALAAAHHSREAQERAARAAQLKENGAQ